MLASRGKPDWLKIRAPTDTKKFDHIKSTLRKHGLHTVCEESHCPNVPDCWANEGTATFMVLGDECTRGCKFCNVKTRWSAKPPDADEPQKLARAVAEIGLDYIVITSVDRDDLKDQGSAHFAACIRAVKALAPEMLVEVLTPDFRGDRECIRTVVEANPNVYAHNIETVRRLQSTARDKRAGYEQSLGVLRYIKDLNPKIYTKSSIIVGFGETQEEVLQTMDDLRASRVDILTIGQYLRPSEWHLPVTEYVKPEVFELYKQEALRRGFLFVAAGPFVRSSYKAGELFIKHALQKA
ncbi:MAG: lipoyl synthase [Candidatus Aenigmatarchaeota archaeon]|nr:MAG: lipoyl synthase [Candidatus Aenigmarchaeota archaeon]